MKSNRIIELFASIPLFWDVFEFIFGADKQKKQLYRSKLLIPNKLMDFGCSSGNTTEAFLDFDYTGVDIDKESILYARNKWKGYPNIKFLATDILQNNNRLGKFDSILFAGTGHHLTDSTLIEIFNVLDKYLKKGGEIYYFDTIRPEPSSHILTRWICSIDRGGHIRTKNQTLKIIHQLSKKYRTVGISVENVFGTFIPQPSYLYVRLKSKNA